MSRATLILRSQADRARAVKWAMSAPRGTRLEFKEIKRTLPQNDRLWASLTDLSKQVVWYGQKLTTTDWKDVMTAALVKARIVPNIDGNGFVQLGLHTSDMSKDELSNLLELIYAFGAKHGVIFHDHGPAAEDASSRKAAVAPLRPPPQAGRGNLTERETPDV